MSTVDTVYSGLERELDQSELPAVVEPLRIAIVGCRDYNDFEFFKTKVEAYLEHAKTLHPGRPIWIYGGGAPGVDDMAEDFALDNGYHFERFDADWDKLGPAAGFIRNQKLAESVEWVLSFWDGKSSGTLDMRERSMRLHRRLRTIQIACTEKRYYCRRKLAEWARKPKG